MKLDKIIIVFFTCFILFISCSKKDTKQSIIKEKSLDLQVLEVYQEGKLIGGLYGVAIGGAFFGESMFSRVSNASKIALCHLMARLKYGNFKLLDAQFVNEHLLQFGIESIEKKAFQKKLEDAINCDANLKLDVPESIVLHFLWHDNRVTS